MSDLAIYKDGEIWVLDCDVTSYMHEPPRYRTLERSLGLFIRPSIGPSLAIATAVILIHLYIDLIKRTSRPI